MTTSAIGRIVFGFIALSAACMMLAWPDFFFGRSLSDPPAFFTIAVAGFLLAPLRRQLLWVTAGIVVVVPALAWLLFVMLLPVGNWWANYGKGPDEMLILIGYTPSAYILAVVTALAVLFFALGTHLGRQSLVSSSISR